MDHLRSRTSPDVERGEAVALAPIKQKALVTTRTYSVSSESSFVDERARPVQSLPYPTPPPIEELEVRDREFELPSGTFGRLYRWLRWDFFSTYRRLFAIIFSINAAVIIAGGVRNVLGKHGLTYSNTISAASANFALSIVVRNEHVVNMLFKISSSLEPTAPFWVRRYIAKIYAYGGIHSGCATSAVAWYVAFAVQVAVREKRADYYVDSGIAVVTAVNLFALLAILIFAHPSVRAHYHDWFERTHRFSGWLVLVLFWAQTIHSAYLEFDRTHANFGMILAKTPSFWCLLIISYCIAYPWIRLRKRAITVEALSKHAVRLRFDYADVNDSSAARLATNPLDHTHAFAVIPNTKEEGKGFSMVVSNAGDWTRKLIENPPTHIWMKGIPFYGVIRIAKMFSPVLVVATGSGIGPCLSLFHGNPNLNCRVLWSTPSPEETFGKPIIDDVLKADPDATIIDTRKTGRPRLLYATWRLAKEKGCEAVVIISNPRVTRSIVYGLEARGVPAYAPIFDS